MKETKVVHKRIHFYPPNKFYENDVLATVRLKMQLIPNKELVLMKSYESAKIKIVEALRAKNIITKFKMDPANSSFLERGTVSEISNRSQVAKIYTRKTIRKTGARLPAENSLSFNESKQQLAKLMSPSVFSNRSFDSP